MLAERFCESSAQVSCTKTGPTATLVRVGGVCRKPKKDRQRAGGGKRRRARGYGNCGWQRRYFSLFFASGSNGRHNENAYPSALILPNGAKALSPFPISSLYPSVVATVATTGTYQRSSWHTRLLQRVNKGAIGPKCWGGRTTVSRVLVSTTRRACPSALQPLSGETRVLLPPFCATLLSTLRDRQSEAYTQRIPFYAASRARTTRKQNLQWGEGGRERKGGKKDWVGVKSFFSKPRAQPFFPLAPRDSFLNHCRAEKGLSKRGRNALVNGASVY